MHLFGYKRQNFEEISMKKASLLTLAILATQVYASPARPPVVYGDDNRLEVFEAPPLMQKLAKSTASMIDRKEITPASMGTSSLTQRTLKEWLENPKAEARSGSPLMSKMEGVSNLNLVVSGGVHFCAEEKYTNQPNPAMCSGFLIGPDLLMTAGHCVEIENFCETFKWVFDFKVDQATGKAGLNIPNENIYSCKKIITHALDMSLSRDFGLVQLDRQVTGREPLLYRTESFLKAGDPVTVIGGPSGLPIKVSGGANVRKSEHPFFFTANLDTFQGNSGSAVFNSETGLVEGILVRGEDDFEINTTKLCLQAKKCPVDGCRGEDVSRMTSVPEVALKASLEEAIDTNNVELLDQVLEFGAWVDFYGKDGVSALMRASEKSETLIVEKLIAKKADVTLADAQGNTALHHAAKSAIDNISVLVAAKASLDARNNAGQTSLLVAAKALNLASVKLLINAGADKGAVDNSGFNVMTGFSQAGDAQAIKELIALGVAAPVVQ
jgi:V8-like Glu-specific endopeptidase